LKSNAPVTMRIQRKSVKKSAFIERPIWKKVGQKSSLTVMRIERKSTREDGPDVPLKNKFVNKKSAALGAANTKDGR